MTDADEDSEPMTREERVYQLLEHRIRQEIQWVNESPHHQLGLTDDAIDALVFGIASGLDNAFDIDWSPKGLRRGEFHSWQEGMRTRARCPICLMDSPPEFSRSLAFDWVRTHMTAEHPSSATTPLISR